MNTIISLRKLEKFVLNTDILSIIVPFVYEPTNSEWKWNRKRNSFSSNFIELNNMILRKCDNPPREIVIRDGNFIGLWIAIPNTRNTIYEFIIHLNHFDDIFQHFQTNQFIVETECIGFYAPAEYYKTVEHHLYVLDGGGNNVKKELIFFINSLQTDLLIMMMDLMTHSMGLKECKLSIMKIMMKRLMKSHLCLLIFAELTELTNTESDFHNITFKLLQKRGEPLSLFFFIVNNHFQSL